jgi:spermidine/putrescine transport system ATP-binding protein
VNTVELRHVTKVFGSIPAVADISLEIGENEFFSLLGPSGCGKSTLLRIIAGLEHPTEGSVYLKGQLVNQVPAYRRSTNLIFQQLALFPHLDVFENIAFGLKVRKLDSREVRQKVTQALELVDLREFGRRPVQSLSGGQRQRVAIARALVNEPPVLLLDEPLGALDMRLRAQMQEELKEIQHRVGTTFVYVTHDQMEALTMSDRIAVLRDGRIEQIGTGREIYDTPRTAFVASFIGDTNLLRGTVTTTLQGSQVVTLDTGLLTTPRNQTAGNGTAVQVSVRPERIRVDSADPPSGSTNAWPAHVRAVTFKGAYTEYRLATATGLVLLARVPVGTPAGFAPGQRVVVSWEIEDCLVLAE